MEHCYKNLYSTFGRIGARVGLNPSGHLGHLSTGAPWEPPPPFPALSD